jgi:uncharacterized protein
VATLDLLRNGTVAGVDGYRHLGLWWLMCIAGVGAIGMALDLLAGALGAKRVGSSSWSHP